MSKLKKPSKVATWRMFNEIAPRYDLVNRLMSFGMDQSWRRRMTSYLPKNQDMTVLDVATGTGDVAILMQRTADVSRVVGVDMAEKMLDQGRQKLKTLQLDQAIELLEGDATALPFPDGQFDAVSISFGIRNVESVPTALSEMARVLKPGGHVIILESSLPNNRIIRWFDLLYLRVIMPFLGGIISGNSAAYRYLNVSIEGFPYGEAFSQLLREAGFSTVTSYPQFMGVATTYVGKK
ncbi:bifunctional demethylmenaquinone methyltransferase/2-methoxy-6-polyprenyl-1,4-benzoquinol methylase UbiE [bacterium]|jgi:demethylmenaquinone methyltransferase / 2-methoxy-6-polyprenyl-1,4-benzoquinol methylase|nr:bifunctional demethylmenaquinone methyltransferase/2-methoxy-6-polyprenyl-1,4-benzoquinol methylase UbiE [bacterium]